MSPGVSRGLTTMTTTTADGRSEVAEAFATHRFADTYDHLAADVRWFTNGGEPRIGRDAAVDACEGLLGDLAHSIVDLVYLETHVEDDSVVVHTVTRYVDLTGTCVVESQDTFDFEDGAVVAITSYVAEVAESAAS